MNCVVVGVCGGNAERRAQVVREMASHVSGAVDITVPPFHRVPWGRGEVLEQAIEESHAPYSFAAITCLEEADAIEAAGGHVVHIEGVPSLEIPIRRHTVMVTLSEPRGRYVMPATAVSRISEMYS